MGYYHLDLDALSEFKDIPVEKLKDFTYAKLEAMITEMNQTKILERQKRNAADKEFERLVLKYFEPVPFLRHWFTDTEIVLACAQTNVTERNLCKEFYVTPGSPCPYTKNEYVRTGVVSVTQYDSHGRALLEPISKKMDIYRVTNQYQSTCQGAVVKYLVYERYPELKPFGFEFYSMSYRSDYEIYPKNHIYVPFTAMMSGDIDRIIHRNRTYSAWYNNGIYTAKECEERLHSEDAQAMFDIFREIGKAEKAAGHSVYKELDNDVLESADSMMTSRISLSGNLMMLEKADSNTKDAFRIVMKTPYTVKEFVDEFHRMNIAANAVIVASEKSDYLNESAVAVNKKNMDAAIADRMVFNVFGYWSSGVCHLIIRMEEV